MAGFSLLKPLGFFYAVVLILVLTYLWYSGKWKQKAGWIILMVSTALGFLISSPLAPHQFQELVLRNVQGLGVSLQIAAAGLLIIVLLTLLSGRFFCGYLCPVGAVQELASRVPVPKLVPLWKVPLMVVRGVVFVVFLYMAWVLSASLLDYFGIRDFFALALTTGSIVFVVMLLVSLVFYRPFCRVICPYGLILSLAGGTSIFALQRTDACIDCKCCEKACPVDEAKRDDRKAECYLCGRCTDVCPAAGALQYQRRTGKEKS
jgi:ferredoxin-type protein NapH